VKRSHAPYTAAVPEPQIRYCTTSDGVSIAYYEMGEGPPLVIAAPTIWGNVRYSPLYMPEYQRTGEGVGRGMRVVRYDSRGSGMSDRAALDFSMEARIRDLATRDDHVFYLPFSSMRKTQ